MHSDNGMMILHRLTTHELPIAPGAICLWITIMLSVQSFQQLLDRLREAVIRSDL
jgi:hypothetical protein